MSTQAGREDTAISSRPIFPVEERRVQAEMAYWQGLFNGLGTREAFLVSRQQDYAWVMDHFQGVLEETGLGLDIGCGPISVLEFSPVKKVYIAIDRLIPFYDQMLSGLGNATYLESDAEDLPFEDGSIDWVLCVNMIAHTPNPNLVLSEIHRVLKPGGRLYFEVHFDPICYAPHYGIWNDIVVSDRLAKFFLMRGVKKFYPQWARYCYWGNYLKTGRVNENEFQVGVKYT